MAVRKREGGPEQVVTGGVDNTGGGRAENSPGRAWDPGAVGFSVGFKIWLDKNGVIIGDGIFKLLINIKVTGSISRASREMGMSYRAAWGKIKTAEAHGGIKLISTQVGGEMGGGAVLTPEGEELVQKYGLLRQEVNRAVQNIFEQIFRGHAGS
ncbi:MAG: LysR family transcriptional regulator [Bacillota bacterium]